MTRNEDKYPKPDTFMPERFIDEHGNLNDDNMMLVFGFGRRSVSNPIPICFYLISR
jgi:cytochrome P450